VDVERVRPAQDANVVAAEQIETLLGRLEAEGTVPLFVFDAGYDPVKLQRGLEGSPCQILVRLRAGATPASVIRLRTSDALVATGRR
jgi:hypothetical protein